MTAGICSELRGQVTVPACCRRWGRIFEISILDSNTPSGLQGHVLPGEVCVGGDCLMRASGKIFLEVPRAQLNPVCSGRPVGIVCMRFQKVRFLQLDTSQTQSVLEAIGKTHGEVLRPSRLSGKRIRKSPISRDKISPGMPAIPLLALALTTEQILLLGISCLSQANFHRFWSI